MNIPLVYTPFPCYYKVATAPCFSLQSKELLVQLQQHESQGVNQGPTSIIWRFIWDLIH